MGRILMESKQFRDVKVDKGRGIVIKTQMRNKYTRCSGNEEQGAHDVMGGVESGEGEEDEGSWRVSKMCGKYLRYCRNLLLKKNH